MPRPGRKSFYKQAKTPIHEADEVTILSLGSAFPLRMTFALQFASKELRADRDIVPNAVTKNGGALACASNKELQADREIALAEQSPKTAVRSRTPPRSSRPTGRSCSPQSPRPALHSCSPPRSGPGRPREIVLTAAHVLKLASEDF